MIQEMRPSASFQVGVTSKSSQRHGLNPKVIRLARFGEPIFKGLGSFERPAPVIFSVIFFTASYAKSASIKKIENRERRTLDP